MNPNQTPPVTATRVMDPAVMDLVVFQLDELRFALPLVAVSRIFRAVEVTALPGAPPFVLGVVDVHGTVVPVVSARRRFLRRDRDITPGDLFVLAQTATRRVILVVDAADRVVQRMPRERPMPQLARSEAFPGVIRLDDGLVLIHDLEKVLSAEDARALATAMTRVPQQPE